MLTADYIFLAALVFVIAFTLYFAPRIRAERIVMQWKFDGTPTWHAPKRVGIWAVPAVMLATRLFIWVTMTYVPAWVNRPELGVVLLALIGAGAHAFILWRAVKAS